MRFIFLVVVIVGMLAVGCTVTAEESSSDPTVVPVPTEEPAEPTPLPTAAPTAAPTAVPAATPVPTSVPEPTAEPTPDDEPPVSSTIEEWLGTYEWVEFAEGDPGSNQTIVHELILDGLADDGSLTGVLTESGFQTNVTVSVSAFGGETGITLFADSDGPPRYTVDQRLLALSGDPQAPVTTLAAVQPYLADPTDEPGTYFEPIR